MPTPNRFDLTAPEATATAVNNDMDPLLQVLVARRRAGMVKAASASTDADEVAVVARVSDPQKWDALGEVRQPLLIGKTPANEYIVTGRLPIHRVERVHEQEFVLSLKAARPVRPLLMETTRETAATPALLPAGHQAHGGAGVVVGVIDYGGDFAHQNFRRNDGGTRLLAIWDQNGGNLPSSPFGYGREFLPAAINMALGQPDPYGALGYDPGDFDTGTGTHGTHVMDIAAGNGRGSGVPGMAPEADLIFVNITHDKDPTGVQVVGESFGNSVTLLEAIRYILDRAGARPTVINVSLGTNGGPHDGSTLVEQGIDAVLQAAPNRAVVMAASNSFDDGIHATGAVPQGGSVDLRWDVGGVLSSDIEMEVWYPGADRFKVELFGPNSALLLAAAPGTSQQLMSGTQVAVFIANRLDDPNNHDNMIGVFLSAGMPPGTYVVRLTGEAVTAGQFHAWIERDNSFQSQFLPPLVNSHTIGSISCGQKLIAVGSYNAHVAGRPLSYFSSAGPTRDGREKPEVSAPGHDVWAAKSGTATSITRKSGTSMASPAVAGLIALVFAEARARNLDLSIDQTRAIVIGCARRTPPPGAAWHDRYGHGRVSAAAALQAVIASPAGGIAPAAASTKKRRGARTKPK
jgi:subtilisin family serine protease